MKYCKRCGQVWSDTSCYRQTFEDKNFCDCCGNRDITDDGVTGAMFEAMSEEEKYEYDRKLIHIIENSGELDQRLWNTYHNPKKTTDFYYYFHYDRYETIPSKRAGRRETEEEIRKRDEEIEAKYGKNSPAYERQILENCINKGRETNTQNSNQVHCPYCSSTNVKRISGGERAVSIAMLGIFSKKINKSFKCLNCKGTF